MVDVSMIRKNGMIYMQNDKKHITASEATTPRPNTINPVWAERMKEPEPIDCMPNIQMCIRMTNYLHDMEDRKYTIPEMTEQITKCWNMVLNVCHRDDKKC